MLYIGSINIIYILTRYINMKYKRNNYKLSVNY